MSEKSFTRKEETLPDNSINYECSILDAPCKYNNLGYSRPQCVHCPVAEGFTLRVRQGLKQLEQQVVQP